MLRCGWPSLVSDTLCGSWSACGSCRHPLLQSVIPPRPGWGPHAWMQLVPLCVSLMLSLLGAPPHVRRCLHCAWPLDTALGTFFEVLSVFACQGRHSKILQTVRLKQQSCVFPQFWMLEVQGQGVGMVDDFQDLSPWVAGAGGGRRFFCVLSGCPSVHSHPGGLSL